MKLVIGFSKPKDHPFPIFSKLIKWFEGTEYSHTYLKWYSESYDKWIVYHSAGFGVHFLGERQADKKLDIVKEYELEITPAIKRDIVGYCIEWAGTPYGLLTVLGIFLKRTFKLKKNPFKDGTDTQFCSEVVARVLAAHLDIKLFKSPDEFGIRDLELLIRDLGVTSKS